MSKGSKRRPGDMEAYRENWDRIFGRPALDSLREQQLNADDLQRPAVRSRNKADVRDSGETPC